MKRYLGLDYGDRSVGTAVSDALGLTAQPLETIWRKEENRLRPTLRRIEELAAQYGVSGIVLGYPVHMDGSEGERAEKTRAFAELLKRRTGLPVYFSDERLTTAEADDILAFQGVPARERKRHIDQVAASLILSEWLKEHEQSDLL